MNESVEKKINKLIKLLMTKGVQPSELADNIFLSNYKRISFLKQKGNVVGELVFEENMGSFKTDVVLRYYFRDNTVTLIEEESYNGNEVIWNREMEEVELINEIGELMQKHYNPEKVASFIGTLPTELAAKLKYLYDKTA